MLAFFNENAPDNISNYDEIMDELYTAGYFPPQVVKQVTSKKSNIHTYEDKEYS